MRITAVELYHVAMPLVYPFRTSFGSEEVIESVLVCLRSGEAYGWGETSPLRHPSYSGEWAGGAFLVMRERLAPALLGQEVASGADVQRLLARFRGNYFAKGGLDLAWWDLYARSLGQPLWRVIGGQKDVVDVGADLGVMDSLPQLLEEIGHVAAAGFKRLKLKYRPGWELNMLAAVRAEYPQMVIHVDCNSAYTLGDLPMLRQLDDYSLAMIEQPLMHDDLLDHAALQRAIRTPICLDESITSLDKARQAIEIGACGWANIKLGRVGGLTNALAIHDYCQAHAIPCWVGGMLESAVGQSHNLAMATLPNIKYPSDIFPTSRFYRRDLGDPQLDLCGPSQMRLPGGAGCGVVPSPEQLQRLTVQQARLRA